MMRVPIDRFFDALSHDYTATIERCFPRYREMLWALLAYLPPQPAVRSILELGCGTGNLSVLLGEAFPQAAMHLVDISSESLAVCRDRLGQEDRFTYEQQDFRLLRYEAESFDLIASSISVHHLTASEKQRLFQDVYTGLQPGGVFTFADQFRGAADDVNEQHMKFWRRASLAAGSSDEEFAMWMEHQRRHDHHDTLKDQMDWLSNIGFCLVDSPWRYLLWSVVQARKSGTQSSV